MRPRRLTLQPQNRRAIVGWNEQERGLLWQEMDLAYCRPASLHPLITRIAEVGTRTA
jgi:hypothetical protein